jgi:hypothetical protein
MGLVMSDTQISKENKKQDKSGKRNTSAKRSYPRISLQEALRVGQVIKELNGGNPWTPSEISKALEIGSSTNNFYYYTTSSRDFGITTGNSRSPQIELTDFGRELLYAPNEEEELQKKIEAFFNVPIFKKVLEHYKGAELPEMKYLGNTLEMEFELDPQLHEEFSKLFRENTKYLGISKGFHQKGDDSIDKTELDATRIVGQPSKKLDKNIKAFVIMPFSEKNSNRSDGFFKEVLDSLIIPAGIESGFVVETANRQGSDIIQSTIINQLLNADLVIADLTDHNPNVLFELGIRLAIEKPVAIIKSSDTGRIFDVDNLLRVYEYNSNLWKSTVEDDLPNLTDHVKATWENRESTQSYMKILKNDTVS